MSLTFDLTMASRGLTAAATVDGVVGLVGASGAGKTTLVRALAGLLDAEGSITLGGRRLESLPAHARRLGVVFQHGRLFPHLTVEANLAYGARRPVQAMADRLGLTALLPRRPSSLSGGERRRVALARALLSDPDALLLDEPMTGLDPGLRADLLPWLRRTLTEAGVPTLWVGHRVEDVLAVADALVVLDRGRVVTQGAPADVLAGSGASVRRLGVANVLEPVDGRWGGVEVVGPPQPSGATRLLLDPDDVLLARDAPGPTSARNVWPAIVRRVDDGPAVSLDVGGRPLVVDVTTASVATLGLQPGAPVWALVKARALRWV